MPLHSRLLLRVEQEEDVAVVRATTADLGEANLPAFGQELFRLADGLTCSRLRLDLAAVTFLNSSALGKLVGLHTRLRAAGRRLVIVNVADPLYEVFEVTRLDQLLDVRRGPDDGADMG